MSQKNSQKYKITIPDIDYYRQIIKCTSACPIDTPAGRYVQEVGRENFEKAYNLARRTNPFVYTCARVCAHPCEDACRRGRFDQPVAINALKRVATDHHHLGLGHHAEQQAPVQKKDRKVAVIGSGPCGLSCAHDLALLGYRVTIFESQLAVGGMLMLGLPIYRLPRDLLKMEIEAILSLGVEIKTGSALGRDFTITDLKNRGYEAIFIAIGAHRSKDVRIVGSDLDGVLKGVEFLLAANLGNKVDLGKRICVIGGGNVAIDVARSVTREKASRADEDGSTTIDAARTALRMGAEEVHVVCLESREEMPAFEYEVDEAEKEGIILYPSRGPKRIIGKNGKVTGLEIIKCTSVFDREGRFNPSFEEGSESILTVDSVILAIGQMTDFSFIQPAEQLEVTAHGTIKVDPDSLATTSPGVFIGGDAAFGPRIIVDAIADGQKAAKSIHLFLGGGKIKVKPGARMSPVADYQMPAGYTAIPRQEMPTLPVEKRLGIAEVQLGFSNEQSYLEGKRCLKCNVNTIFNGKKCILCGGCIDICPEYCLKMVPLHEVEDDNEELQKLVAIKLEITVEEMRRMSDEEKKQLGTLMLKDEENCIRCGLCAQRCPTAAITMELFEYEEEFIHE